MTSTPPPVPQSRGRSWYREPWAWFLVGMLVITLVWGAFLILTSLRYADKPVVDDYYQAGKVINMDSGRARRARQLGLAARLLWQPETHGLEVTLTGDADWPQQLLLHATPDSSDKEAQTLVLQRSSDATPVYRARAQSLSPGDYWIQINTLDAMVPEKGYVSGWRLTGTIVLAPGEPVTLPAL